MKKHDSFAQSRADIEAQWSSCSAKTFISKDGGYVGDYESMYRECADPWLQDKSAYECPLREAVLFWTKQLRERRIMDIGCGKGAFTERARCETNAEVLGVDVSETAVNIARESYPKCRFESADASAIGRFADFKPTAIFMFGVTWCILDRFEEVLNILKLQFAGARLFHMMTFYGPGQQKYGRDYFTEWKGLLPYFKDMKIRETLEHRYYPLDGSCNTLLVADL